MNIENFKWRVNPSSILDAVEVGRVNAAAELMNITEAIAIDSYQMSADGPKIWSIFLVNDSYIVEVRLTSRELEFDICSARSVVNLRVEYAVLPAQPAVAVTQVVNKTAQGAIATEASAVSQTTPQAEPSPETEAKRYVTVSLLHGERMSSGLSFFGAELDAWLRFVLAAYPKDRLLQ